MAHIGTLIFFLMLGWLSYLAKLYLLPKNAQPRIQIATLWQQATKNINKSSAIDERIIKQALELQEIDLKGSFEQNEQEKQQIYNEYYFKSRLLVINLLPEDASQLNKNEQHNVVQLASHINNLQN